MSSQILLRLLQYTLSVAAFAAASTTAAETYANRAEVRSFVADMVKRHGFNRRSLEKLFAQAAYQDNVVTLMTPLPPEQRSWQNYRGNFVTPRRIEGGVEFWRRNASVLTRAASKYGVPPEIIVAIIGIETQYGRNTGGFKVLDALATLAFDYPRRSDYFRSELEQFLLYTREARLEPASLRGSYAGAIGIPQFMPGTIRRYAVDFDSDGRRDLHGSTADAIGSVANFLANHGWVPGAPIAFPTRVESEAHRRFIDGGVDPIRRVAELREFAIEVDQSVDGETACVLIELESPDAQSEYLVGLENFYVLTRYNRSSFYAAAVLQLADAVKTAYRTP
jgi:membrane-bound lytic murein transglycosylase B